MNGEKRQGVGCVKRSDYLDSGQPGVRSWTTPAPLSMLLYHLRNA